MRPRNNIDDFRREEIVKELTKAIQERKDRKQKVGLRVNQISLKYGITQPTLYKWKRESEAKAKAAAAKPKQEILTSKSIAELEAENKKLTEVIQGQGAKLKELMVAVTIEEDLLKSLTAEIEAMSQKMTVKV